MRFAAIAASLTLISVPVLANEPDAQKKDEAVQQQKPAEEKNEEVCKYIRADMSSRRKQKVCMTQDQWVEFNSGN